MDPLDDSECAQYRANCFRSCSALIATVMPKATIMLLTGAPSLPIIAPVSRQNLANNTPDVFDVSNYDELHRP
jgi:hypothetical protein